MMLYGIHTDEFTDAYLEAAAFTDCGPDDDENHNADGWSKEAIQHAVDSCTAFQRDYADLLAQAYEREGYGETQAGHDFWLTRNGHGAGFWDRSALEAGALGDRLTAVAKSFGEVWVYTGDDNMLYIG